MYGKKKASQASRFSRASGNATARRGNGGHAGGGMGGGMGGGKGGGMKGGYHRKGVR